MSSTNSKVVLDSSKSYTNIVFYISIFITIIVIGGSFFGFSQLQGSGDSWIEIKPQVLKILIFTLIGLISLTVSVLFYFIQDPQKTMYFTLVMSCIAVALSYSAVAIAAITR
jgi:NAD/NADP transhydrogenase beta subunit